MREKTVHIPNISCGHCINTIKREIGDVEGSVHVSGNPETKNVTIKWQDDLEWKTIYDILEEVGYPPE